MPSHYTNPLLDPKRLKAAEDRQKARRQQAEEQVEAGDPALLQADPVMRARTVNPSHLQQQIEALANVNRTAADMARMQAQREIDMMIASALGALPGELFGAVSGTPVQTGLAQQAAALGPGIAQVQQRTLEAELAAQAAKAKADVEIARIGLETEQTNLQEEERERIETAKAGRDAAERKEKLVTGRVKEIEGAEADIRQEEKDERDRIKDELYEGYLRAQTEATKALARQRDAKGGDPSAVLTFQKDYEEYISLRAQEGVRGKTATDRKAASYQTIKGKRAAAAELLVRDLDKMGDLTTTTNIYVDALNAKDAALIDKIGPVMARQYQGLDEEEYLRLAGSEKFLLNVPDAVLESIILGLVQNHPEAALEVNRIRRSRLIQPVPEPKKAPSKKSPPRDRG